MKIKSSFILYSLPVTFSFFILLISISNVFAETDNVVPELSTNTTDTNEPVWNSYNPQSETVLNEKKEGYEKPIATIVPSAKKITQGDIVYFRLEYENAGSSYYWLMGDQRSFDRAFRVDTSTLNIGTHRVRVSVTNKAREQANSQILFEILPKPKNRSETQEVINEREVEVETPVIDPVDYQEQEQEDEEKSDNSDNSEINNTPVRENEAENIATPNITIDPLLISLDQGKAATFKASVALSDDYEFRWRFGTQLSDLDKFQISTNDVIPGTYKVYLSITNNEGEESNATAQLIVRDPEIDKTKVPDLVGKDIVNIDDILEAARLVKGQVEQKEIEANENKGKIISQFPESETEVNINSKIFLVVGVGYDIKIPDVIGKNIEDVKVILSKSSLPFTIEKKQIKDEEEEDGVVLSQHPEAGATLKQGKRVKLVVGEKEIVTQNDSNEPINVTIKGVTLSVEQGTDVILNADIKNNALDNENYIYIWTFGEQKGDQSQFVIKTNELALGEHKIKLQVTEKNRKGKSEAILQIRVKRLLVPSLANLSLDEAQKAISKAGLLLGSVEKQQGKVKEAIVKQQSPAFGEYVRRDQRINLVLMIPEKDKNAPVRVDISFNKTTGKAGEPIIFTTKVITKANLNDIHYVYSINNVKKASVDALFTWVPEVEGTYTVSVTAYNEGGAIAKSELYVLDIDVGWEKPIAKLLPEKKEVKQGDIIEFISNSTYDLNSTLTYEWISSSGHSGNKKVFKIDTSNINAGDYDVTLTITDDKGSQSTTTANMIIQDVIESEAEEKGAKDKRITDSIVQFSTDKDGNGKPSITFNVSRKIVQVGQKIQLNMQVDQKAIDILYYYQLGDKKRRQWMKISTFEHQYNSIGSYSVRAVIKQNGKVYYSDSVTIWVWSSWLLGIVGGIGVFLFILIGWWTKHTDKSDEIKPLYAEEEQIPLPQTTGKHEIFTENRKQDTVKSVLIKGITQFILGIFLSFIILYIILKLMGLA